MFLDPWGLVPNPACVAACIGVGGIIGGGVGSGIGGAAGALVGSLFGPAGSMAGGSLGTQAGSTTLGPLGAIVGGGAGGLVGKAICPDVECSPPKGTICYMIDRVPPSVPHYPITGSHYHLWQMNQAQNGKCYWNKIGASPSAPPGAIPCSFARPPR